MTLGRMATEAGGFSDQTVTCLLDKTESLDFLGLLSQNGIGPEFSIFMQATALCLSDEELLRSQGFGSVTAEQLRCVWSLDPEVVATFGHQSPEVAELFSKCGISLGLLEGSAGPLRLAPDEEACLIGAIGERALREVYTGQRAPTSDEVDAIAGCGIGGSNPAPGPLLPDLDTLPEASAPAGLGTVAWTYKLRESLAMFGRLPSEIAGHGIRPRFEQLGAGIFSTTYGGDTETTGNVMVVTVHDLTKGAFFPRPIPTPVNSSPSMPRVQTGRCWLREGWVTSLGCSGRPAAYNMMHWGNAPSSIVFQAMANDPGELMALVEAVVSVASG